VSRRSSLSLFFALSQTPTLETETSLLFSFPSSPPLPLLLNSDDPAFDDTKEKEESTGGVVDTAADAAGTVGGVIGGVGTILETFVD